MAANRVWNKKPIKPKVLNPVPVPIYVPMSLSIPVPILKNTTKTDITYDEIIRLIEQITHGTDLQQIEKALEMVHKYKDLPFGHDISCTTEISFDYFQSDSEISAIPSPMGNHQKTIEHDNVLLKYMIGVEAWNNWIIGKNAELEKLYVKQLKTSMLNLPASDLNASLCLFIKELRKTNGAEYTPDMIYYMVLGIYLI